jgi:hypothetical protein
MFGEAVMDSKPQYTHDCDKCIFLGIHRNGDEISDLYYCKQNIGAPTVIARFGNYGADYTSGMSFVGHNVALTEAHRRWLLLELARLTAERDRLARHLRSYVEEDDSTSGHNYARKAFAEAALGTEPNGY